MMIYDPLRHRHRRQRGLFVSRAIAPQSLDAATRLFCLAMFVSRQWEERRGGESDRD